MIFLLSPTLSCTAAEKTSLQTAASSLQMINATITAVTATTAAPVTTTPPPDTGEEAEEITLIQI